MPGWWSTGLTWPCWISGCRRRTPTTVERVARTSEFVEALRRVADGDVALDPEVVTLVMRGGRRSRVDTLTAREREVLELMAQGHSNRSIAALLVVSERAVEKHVAAVFGKFELRSTHTDNRRVKAVSRPVGRGVRRSARPSSPASG